MTIESLKLLHVEDSQDDSDLLLHHLKRTGIVPTYKRVETKESFISALEAGTWDAVVCDYHLPHFDAFEAVKVLKSFNPDIPFIVVSGSIGEEKAVEAMRAGAADYVMKDNLTRLVPVLQRELNEAEQRKKRRQMEEALELSEANLRQAQKLESIGLLAGGIAHDFNNILATIILQSEVLMYELEMPLSSAELAEKAKKCVAEIKKSSERATGLTKKLLAFSRKQMIQPTVLSLNSLIVDMREMLERVVEENIEFDVELSPNLKNIHVDRGPIEQILLNLVINSRDAMPKGGKIKIETKNVVFDEVAAKKINIQPGHCICLTISDTGTGMTEEVKKNLFQPFFTTKPPGKGTGLGLSTIYGIMQQNKGQVLVESEFGKGTSFALYFPATEEKLEALPEGTDEKSALHGNETILVVEDEHILKNLIGEILVKNGYKVLKASSGTEALEIIRGQNGIDLVISDVVMPQMGGVELASHVQSINKDIKFLFQSGYMSDTLRENGMESERINFIQKPYKPNVLLTEIKKILVRKN
jgi:signal transduction histidine kinase